MDCPLRSLVLAAIVLGGCYDPTQGGSGAEVSGSETTAASTTASTQTTAPTSGATMSTSPTSADTTMSTTVDETSSASVTTVVDESTGPLDACEGLICGRVDGQDCGSCQSGECIQNLACCTEGSVVGSVDTAGTAVGIDVAGSHAYVADYEIVRVIDVADPSAMVEVATATAASYAWDIRVASGRAYVAWAYAGLVVLDVSNPNAPIQLGADANALGTGVAVEGNYAYVAGGASSTFYVVDVANAAMPSVVGSLPLAEQFLRATVEGGYAYLPVEYDGFRVVDLSDPTLPVDVGVFTPAIGIARDIAVVGTVGWAVIGYEGLVALDLSDPNAPAELGRVDIMDNSGTLGGIAIAGNIAAVAHGDVGLRFFEISDPSAPVEVGALAIPDARDLVIAGGVAYVAAGANGVTAASLPECGS